MTAHESEEMNKLESRERMRKINMYGTYKYETVPVWYDIFGGVLILVHLIIKLPPTQKKF